MLLCLILSLSLSLFLALLLARVPFLSLSHILPGSSSRANLAARLDRRKRMAATLGQGVRPPVMSSFVDYIRLFDWAGIAAWLPISRLCDTPLLGQRHACMQRQFADGTQDEYRMSSGWASGGQSLVLR